MSNIHEQASAIPPELISRNVAEKRPFTQVLLRFAKEAYLAWKQVEPHLFFGSHYYTLQRKRLELQVQQRY